MINLLPDALTSLALITVLLPFLGAAIIGLSPHVAGKWICQIFAAATLVVLFDLVFRFAAGGHAPVTHDLIVYGSTQILRPHRR